LVEKLHYWNPSSLNFIEQFLLEKRFDSPGKCLVMAALNSLPLFKPAEFWKLFTSAWLYTRRPESFWNFYTRSEMNFCTTKREASANR
jgi:hypothetical protein